MNGSGSVASSAVLHNETITLGSESLATTAEEAKETALEAIRVDDIETVQAQPLDSRKRHRIYFGGAVAIILVLVLSVLLGKQGSNDNDSPTDNVVSTPSPTLAPFDRLDLL